GVAFDFFNISGSLFVDKETDMDIRNSAQGLFMMMTNGFGATIGTLLAQMVVNHYVYNLSPDAGPTAVWEGWNICWYIFAAYSLVVALAFAVLFRYKHVPAAE
ncbi:MAG: MFS transporter, partial [Bacteroidaceae bacterium]|nr:MFS transporter [Bacteroidaceae bacterium]